MNVFFISDTHFGHENILKFEKEFRNFQTIEEHDEKLIENWNSVVKPNDKIYHLGDFCWKRKYIEIAKRLNGRKCLILGNHDVFPAKEYLEYFYDVKGVKAFGRNIVLTHVPVNPQQLEYRWQYNIHGHLHSNVLEDKRYINVSCEQINLTPIHFDELCLEK